MNCSARLSTNWKGLNFLSLSSGKKEILIDLTEKQAKFVENFLIELEKRELNE